MTNGKFEPKFNDEPLFTTAFPWLRHTSSWDPKWPSPMRSRYLLIFPITELRSFTKTILL